MRTLVPVLRSAKIALACGFIVAVVTPASAVTYRGFGVLPGGIKVKMKLSAPAAPAQGQVAFQGVLRCRPAKAGMCLGSHAPISGRFGTAITATTAYPAVTTNCGLGAELTSSCFTSYDGQTYTSTDPTKLLCGELDCYHEGDAVSDSYRTFQVMLRRR